MKIAVLGIRGFPNIQGGVEKHCENLYPRLVKNGCEIVVFTRKPYVAYLHQSYQGVTLIPLSSPKSKFLEAFVHTFRGVFAAKKIMPDIVHIHAIGPSLCIPLARLLGLKVVMTHHGPDYERKKWVRVAKCVLRLGEYLGVKWANEIICISEPIADRVRRKFHRNVTVIPNGVTIPQFSERDDTLRKYGVRKGKYILAVGRFVPEKGFHDLVSAFNLLYLEDWKLVIVGQADHEDKYSRELKENASRNKNIALTGLLTEELLGELYSQAGLFIIPSYYEGLPIVLLEAMSYGVSCIASDIPANKNVGLSEERFFNPGDIETLSKKILQFLSKPLSEEEKNEQIRLIATKYNWDDIAEMTYAVYKKVAV